jgi:uncharacterized protein YggE
MNRCCIVVFLFFIPAILFAQEFDKNSIIVFGNAEVSIPADNATFTFEVEGEGSTLSQAVNTAREKVRDISGLLFKVGLTEKNLRTSFFHSGENIGNKAFLSSKRDFKAVITVLVNIDSLELLENAIIKVSEAKPESISNIDFSLKDYEQYKMDALEKAILKAKEKANMLASKMDTKLGNILSIEEIQGEPTTFRGGRAYPNPFNVAYEINGTTNQGINSSSGFYAQQAKITAKVRVAIEILGNE